jgi:hypothetical protein
MRHGITAMDAQRATRGYLLFTPAFSPGTVFLLDWEGNEVHRWDVPYRPGLSAYLLPNGNLFYQGKLPPEDVPGIGLWSAFSGGVMAELDWEGNIVWEYRDPIQHNDARRTESGGAIYLGLGQVPPELAARVKGGLAGTEHDGMWADTVIEVDRDGQRVWEWRAWEQLDPETDAITFNEPRGEWTHGNAVVPIDGDCVLVSLRSISTVGLVDRTTGDFRWKVGYDVLSQQHDPTLLANGNLLVFDNGTHPKDRPYRTLSRVIELNPVTKEIAWEYRDAPWQNFFSPLMGTARRLPDGNTFINEGLFGRMFQVTPAGEVVWEYVSPHYYPGFDGSLVNSVYRAYFYMPDEVPRVMR